MSHIQSVIKRSGAIVPFTPERIANAIYRAAVAVGGRDRKTAEELAAQVVELLEQQTPDGKIPTIEEIQDLVEKVLIENGHAKVAKAYILYREERARSRKERAELSSQPSQNVPYAKIWSVLDWAVDHHLNTTAGLNERIRAGQFPEIVRESEACYNDDVENAADLILERIQELKIVIISGPSSSGKTTTTIKVGERLKRKHIHLVTLNVDNYFYDLELHPRDEFGDYDFEMPQALDLAMISEHLRKLTAGEEVLLPQYDFKTGKRTDSVTPMRLKKNELILIDSLHGLFAPMTEGVPDEQKFKLYLEPLLQMKDSHGKFVRWTDLRLIRRMLRDAVHRAYDPRRTLEHWHYVRTSEMRNIIPNVNFTDFIVNTGMPYELPVYSARMREQFAVWEVQYRDDPLREDAYERASRIHALLGEIQPVTDESSIPGDSVLREFIGGSIYKY